MKTYWIRILFPMILSLGLSSCSSDKGEETHLKPNRLPAPVLNGQSLKISLKNEAEIASQIWNLSDALEFSSTGAFTKLATTVRCDWNGAEYRRTHTYPMRTSYKMWDLIPERLLTVTFDDRNTSCDMTFVASTAAGDTHRFEIQKIQITNRNEINEIDWKGVPNSDLALDEDIWQDIEFRMPRNSAQNLKLSCTNADFFSRYDIGDTRTLRDFDFNTVKYGTMNPYQRCRLFALNASNDIEMTSPIIWLKIGESPLKITDISKSRFEWDTLKLNRLTHALTKDIYIKGSGMPVVELKVTNTSQEDQSIVFGQELRHATHCHNGQGVVSAPTRLAIVGNSRFTVPANSKITVQYKMTLDKNSACGFPWRVQIHAPVYAEHLKVDTFHGDPKEKFKIRAYANQTPVRTELFFSKENESITRGRF